VAVLRGLLGEKREEPGRILWMLAQTIRLIWQTKLLVERGWRPGQEVDEETAALLPQEERKNALAQFARRPWLARRTVRQANAFTWGQLTRAVEALNGCDLAMKGIRGKVGDDAVAVELVVVQLCTDLEMPVWDSPKGERAVG
jgi:DNA polymerase III delta subunit